MVLEFSILTPPGKSHFLRSTRNCPADVDVLLSSQLLLMLWHFLRYNSWSVKLHLALSVRQCATLSPVVIVTVDFWSQHGWLSWIYSNKLFVLCSLPKCCTSLLFPPVGHPSHLLALPSLNQNSRSRRALWCPIFGEDSWCCGSGCDLGLITGLNQLKCRIQCSRSYLFIYEGSFLLKSVILY